MCCHGGRSNQETRLRIEAVEDGLGRVNKKLDVMVRAVCLATGLL